jgi:hypothetical protein
LNVRELGAVGQHERPPISPKMITGFADYRA